MWIKLKSLIIDFGQFLCSLPSSSKSLHRVKKRNYLALFSRQNRLLLKNYKQNHPKFWIYEILKTEIWNTATAYLLHLDLKMILNPDSDFKKIHFLNFSYLSLINKLPRVFQYI